MDKDICMVLTVFSGTAVFLADMQYWHADGEQALCI